MAARRIFLVFLVVLNLILGYRLLVGDEGWFGYLKLRREHEVMRQRLDEARERARELSAEIRRLKSDPAYLEDVIRRRMNYVGPGETLYVFPPDEEGQAAPNSAGAQGHENEN
ncbi:FtsB family cell division protein [Desulfocurvus sp. DL9XJH121]